MQRRDRDEILDDSPMTQQSGYEPMRDTDRGMTPPRVSDIERPDEGKAQDVGRQAQDKASQTGEMAKQRTEQGVDKAASGMQSAADKLREQAEGRSGMAAEAGTKAADTMEKASSYLREHDTNEMLDDLEKYVKEHPVQAVAGAVIGGFIVGRILR